MTERCMYSTAFPDPLNEDSPHDLTGASELEWCIVTATQVSYGSMHIVFVAQCQHDALSSVSSILLEFQLQAYILCKIR